MSRVNERGWTPIESDTRWEEDGYYERVKPLCDRLAHEWSRINHVIEQEGFIRRANYENGFNDRDYEEGEEEAEEILRRIQDETQAAHLDAIEEGLNKLGARIMRPYEHWNEDEKWMEYQERDRD